MSRNLNIDVPTRSSNLIPKSVDLETIRTQIRKKKEINKHYYDRSSKPVIEFFPGQCINFQRIPNSYWYPGKIVKRCVEPRSYIIKDKNGSFYRRNAIHISSSNSNTEFPCVQLPIVPTEEFCKNNCGVHTDTHVKSRFNREEQFVKNMDGYVTRSGRVKKVSPLQAMNPHGGWGMWMQGSTYSQPRR